MGTIRINDMTKRILMGVLEDTSEEPDTDFGICIEQLSKELAT